MKTKPQPYDIIGDIHGHADTLRALLNKLGYEERDGAYRHSDRKAIFIGDFIDRGPKIRETPQIVKAMVDTGTALAVMGNHEYDAICFHMPDGNGGYYRPHSEKNIAQHKETLREFEGHDGEWADYLKWFETLPLFLDLGELRVVHACWDAAAITALGAVNRYDASLLAPPDANKDPQHAALNILIKGPEVLTPGGEAYDGGRKDMRVKWWLNETLLTYRNAALQVPFELPDEPIATGERGKVCGYAPDAPPVFFGHYGFLKPAEPIAPNVACIDLGVTRGGPLCAYRWDGERQLDVEKFVAVLAI